MPAFKVCRKCGERKPLDEFYAMKGMRDGHRNDCIDCNKAAKRERHAANAEQYRERTRKWQAENLERVKAYQQEYRKRPDVKRRARAAYYAKKRGISLEEADAILEAQGDRCAICKRQVPDRLASMHLDHDHKTGKIRGFLCIDCNHGLGKFRDEPDLLLRAVVYLREGGFLELLEAG
jgi:hypothetical protein